MTLRLLRVASLGLLIATLVQCKHTTPNVAPGLRGFSSEELRNILDHGSYVLISAGRNNQLDHNMTDDQLLKRSKCLKADLDALGLTYTEAKGHYGPGDSELSFLVPILKPDQPTVLFLGNRYNQDSIVVGNAGTHALVFTTGENLAKALIRTTWKPIPQEEEPEHRTEIQTKEGRSFRFTIQFFEPSNTGKDTPQNGNDPLVDYLDAKRAFDPSFKVPQAVLSPLTDCAALFSNAHAQKSAGIE